MKIMRRSTLGIIRFLLFNWLIMISLNVAAQEIIKPVKKTILLSGNFGELRATHFHSGIDIRTGGVEGLPVVCVKDGQLARVVVSPTGYGQALYVEHPDGTTSVYGHLQRFVPAITEIVRTLQYQKESFRIDENFKDYRLFFRQGDTIAYSGNTGSSGGPHLHFEVRNTYTEHTLNPLHYYRIADTKAPVVRKLYLYSIDVNGCEKLIRSISLKAAANGRYNAGLLSVPAGKIGVAVFATDYMNDSWNKLGVYQMSLVARQDTLFRFSMDSCDFSQSSYINAVKDFACYKRGETVYRCFGNYQQDFMSITNKWKGHISLEKDSVVAVKISLADINGNRSWVDFKLKGSAAKVVAQNDTNILRYDCEHLLELPDCRLKLDKNALFSSVAKSVKTKKDTITGKDIFVFSEQSIPLFKKGHLQIAGQFDSCAIICELGNNGRKYPVATRRTAEGLTAEVGYLSRYVVAEDCEAPTITFLGRFPNGVLKFKVRDNLSGLASYRGEVNGKWCLFTYDPRVSLLQCQLSEPVFQAGQVNEVKIQVKDVVGNSRELVVKVKK